MFETKLIAIGGSVHNLQKVATYWGGYCAVTNFSYTPTKVQVKDLMSQKGWLSPPTIFVPKYKSQGGDFVLEEIKFEDLSEKMGQDHKMLLGGKFHCYECESVRSRINLAQYSEVDSGFKALKCDDCEEVDTENNNILAERRETRLWIC